MKFIDEQSFLEHIGIADIERVHTNTIAWIISDSCRAITKNDKIKFLSEFIGLNKDDFIETIHDETGSIDLLIETNNTIIALENKFKSSQHSNQLERYRKRINELCSKKEKLYIFLTLAPEAPQSDSWEANII